jgi:hypothetical protein
MSAKINIFDVSQKFNPKFLTDENTISFATR